MRMGVEDITLTRRIDAAFGLATLVFVLVLVFIATGWFHFPEEGDASPVPHGHPGQRLAPAAFPGPGARRMTREETA